MKANAGTDKPYFLGHSERELERLTAQARLIDPITRGFFRDAGIVAGMRVLDVGSGAGDTAFLAAGLVGDAGEVIGIDRSAEALAVARARADAGGMRNVTFREGDPAEMRFERPFDAVVGRYILQFQPDPAAMLRSVAAHARSGGVVVFHELDFDGVGSSPPAPLYDRVCSVFLETARAVGGETRFGMNLHATFAAAGLAAPSMRRESLMGGGAECAGPVALMADVLETMSVEMERRGIATVAEMNFETLSARMIDEAIANGSVITARHEMGAWTRV